MYQTGFLLLFTKKDVSAVRTKMKSEVVEVDLSLMDERIIMRNLEEQILGVRASCINN